MEQLCIYCNRIKLWIFKFQENDTLIESVDACFGLARKKARGSTTIASRHGDLLFSDQDDVDNFVNNYPHYNENKSSDKVRCSYSNVVVLNFLFCSSLVQPTKSMRLNHSLLITGNTFLGFNNFLLLVYSSTLACIHGTW